MDSEKLFRVIDSCETLEQLMAASKYFALWEQERARSLMIAVDKFESKRNELS